MTHTSITDILSTPEDFAKIDKIIWEEYYIKPYTKWVLSQEVGFKPKQQKPWYRQLE
jgi:hypothetical protein